MRHVSKDSVWNLPESEDRQEVAANINRDYSVSCSNPDCNKKIFYGTLGQGSNIEIKCPSCKIIFSVRSKSNIKPVDRRYKTKCSNCNHPGFYGLVERGTNIEVLCSKCNMKYYEIVL